MLETIRGQESEFCYIYLSLNIFSFDSSHCKVAQTHCTHHKLLFINEAPDMLYGVSDVNHLTYIPMFGSSTTSSTSSFLNMPSDWVRVLRKEHNTLCYTVAWENKLPSL